MTRAAALALLLLGCTPPPATDLGPPLDPQVASWWPGHAPLPAAERVVFLGDSITAGWGIDASEDRYAALLVDNRADAWPDQPDLSTRYGALEVVDVSVSGARTHDLLDQQIPRLWQRLPAPATGPTLIYITIGGNDLTFAMMENELGVIADRVEDNVRAIAEALTDPDRFPDGALLLLTNVYEPTDAMGQADPCFFGLDVSAVEPVLDDVNARTRALAQELDFGWVDLRGHFRGHGFHHGNPDSPFYEAEDPSLWLQDDCIHPNERGHHELRRLFLAATEGRPFTLD